MAKSKKSTTETIAQQLEETAAIEDTQTAEVVEETKTEETTTPAVEETIAEDVKEEEPTVVKKKSIWAERWGEHRMPRRESKKVKKPNYTSDHLKDSDTSSINFGLNSIF